MKNSIEVAPFSLLKERKTLALVAIWSYLFSLSWVLPLALGNRGVVFCFVVALVLVVPIALAAFCVMAIVNVVAASLRDKELFGGGALNKRGLKSRVVLASFVVAWGAIFLIMYPGCCSTDSNDIFKMVLGLPFESNHFRYDQINNHHPVSYVFLIWCVFQLGASLGLSQAMCIGLVSVTHLLLLVVCLTVFIVKVFELSNSKGVFIFAWVFFLFNPLIAQYSVTVWKDVLFAGFFLVFLVEVALLVLRPELFWDKRSNVAFLVGSGVLCILFRNNAILAIGITLVVLVALKSKFRKRLAIIATAILLPAVIVVGPLYSALHIQSGHFSEALAVPLQQVSRTIAQGGSLSAEQEAFFNEILPIDQYEERYLPSSPNPIKFSEDFDDDFLEENKVQFLISWFQVGCSNPGIYLRAWLAETQGFWNIAYPTWYTTPAGYSLDGSTVSHNHLAGIIDQSDFDSIRGLYIQIFEPIFNIGVLVWLLLFVLMYQVCRRNYKIVLCLMPLLLLWFSFLIAAPANDFRYMFPLHLAVPLLLLLLVWTKDLGLREA